MGVVDLVLGRRSKHDGIGSADVGLSLSVNDTTGRGQQKLSHVRIRSPMAAPRRGRDVTFEVVNSSFAKLEDRDYARLAGAIVQH